MELAAFLSLAALALFRLPALHRGGAGTLSELALITGAGALLMVGVVIPLDDLDRVFGGSNLVNLFQNILATLAIWFMVLTAKHMAAGEVDLKRESRGLVIVIVLFTLPFLMMDRGTTDAAFIQSNAESPWLWLYASIYMGFVVSLMVQMLVALRARTAKPYTVVRLGAISMGAASAIEIVYLSVRLGGGTAEWLGDLFVPIFYGGILLFAVGLGCFPLAHKGRDAALAMAAGLLNRANDAHGVHADEDDPDDTIAHRTYRLAVQLADFGNSATLSRRERVSLRFATALLNLHVPAPPVMKMSAAPRTSA